MSVSVDAVDQEARDMAKDAISHGESHERLCTERWDQQKLSMALVQKTLGEIKDSMNATIGRFPASIIAGLAGLVGWLAARAFPLH
jgi:hypothetical protein